MDGWARRLTVRGKGARVLGVSFQSPLYCACFFVFYFSIVWVVGGWWLVWAHFVSRCLWMFLVLSALLLLLWWCLRVSVVLRRG